MEGPPNYGHLDLSEATLYTASTLNMYGLPYDYDSLTVIDPPSCCLTCNAALCDPLKSDPLHVRLHTWQSHLGRCGGMTDAFKHMNA